MRLTRQAVDRTHQEFTWNDGHLSFVPDRKPRDLAGHGEQERTRSKFYTKGNCPERSRPAWTRDRIERSDEDRPQREPSRGDIRRDKKTRVLQAARRPDVGWRSIVRRHLKECQPRQRIA